MSAAAPPTPPPHRTPVSSNGYNGRPSSTGGGLPSFSGSKGSNDGGVGYGSRPYPHLDDLVARAENRVERNATVPKLLESAQRLLKQSQSSLEFTHPDQAYSEYLSAYNIVAAVIPGHADYLMLHDRPSLSKVHKQLMKDVISQRPIFDRLHDEIKEDNQRRGTKPLTPVTRPHSEVLEGGMGLPQQSIGSQFTTNGSTTSSRNTLNLPSVPGQRPEGVSSSPPASNRYKPPVHRKPEKLHSTAISGQGPRGPTTSQAPSDLTARFANLRVGSNLAQHVSNADDFDTDSSVQRSHGEQLSRDGLSSLQLKTNGMPGSASDNRAADRFGPVDEGINKDLPKLPSPAYSPGRGNGTPIQPPRSLRNSNVTNGGSLPLNTSSSSLSSLALRNSSDQSLGSGRANGSAVRPRQNLRRKSMHLPQETEISATTLYDYLKLHDILLIDVRPRDEYDAGHVFSQSGICIEPAALRPNMSCEELHEALVVSPDNEIALFDARDEFDLVVYFDQSSSTTNFLQSNPSRKSNLSLKYLYDALYEFNIEKPLQYPPVFLTGGIDAWIELMGQQALATSNSAARVKAAKSGRPIARRPLASVTGKLNIQKKRRDYNPLGPDEEEKWRERARSESYVLDSQPQVAEIHDEGETEIVPYVRDYDEFWRRYPDVDTIERQSMTTPTPRVPVYPAPPAYPAPAPPQYQPPPVPASPSRPPPIAQRPSYSGVSERSQSQTPTLKPSNLPAYIPSKLKRLPRTGLHNFGATCYMNATVQCLSATIPLTAFFLDGRFDKYVQKDNWKGSKGIMPELYTNLLRNLWQPNGVDTIRPTNFRKMCARLNKEWASDRQQDAKEFFDFLVDVLHEDLNTNWNRTPLRQLTLDQEAARERMNPFIASMKEWSRYEHRDHSRLTDLFAGQHISRLQCTTCRRNSTTYEPFYSISVEIPEPRPNSRSGGVTLDDCLRSYCAEEMLSGEDVWRCPHCNASREATKRITISRAPEFLIIHFKRFSASREQSARKVHTPVDFPLLGLDLEPYMLPALTTSERESITREFGEEPLRDAPRAMQRPFKYEAYAVMRHLGASMGSGHYIGIVRDAARGCWREFNDERIGDFRPEELPWDRRLQNEMAYIVFYQRVGV